MPSPGTWLTFQPRQSISALCGSGQVTSFAVMSAPQGLANAKGLSLGLVGRIWVEEQAVPSSSFRRLLFIQGINKDDPRQQTRDLRSIVSQKRPLRVLAKASSQRVEDAALGTGFLQNSAATDCRTEGRNVLNRLTIYWGMV
jgi:hypothetical protein